MSVPKLASTMQTFAWRKCPTYATYDRVTPTSGRRLKGMGDLDGNGKTDLFWYDQQTGETSAWMMNATSCSGRVSFGTLVLKDGWSFEDLADVTGNG
ncbi:hypothetical protein [Leptodesmis sp.]|uniref:hypothetical protein n=1 Tax=Leptodesmis sp. TaxID=3100501 RepID=UPI0040534734